MLAKKSSAGAGGSTLAQRPRAADDVVYIVGGAVDTYKFPEVDAGGLNQPRNVCNVCYSTATDRADPIIECVSCQVLVHLSCLPPAEQRDYAAIALKVEDGFTCRRCRVCPASEHAPCAYCPWSTGAMQMCDSGQWAHITCVRYIYATQESVDTEQPVPPPHVELVKEAVVLPERVLCKQHVDRLGMIDSFVREAPQGDAVVGAWCWIKMGHVLQRKQGIITRLPEPPGLTFSVSVEDAYLVELPRSLFIVMLGGVVYPEQNSATVMPTTAADTVSRSVFETPFRGADYKMGDAVVVVDPLTPKEGIYFGLKGTVQGLGQPPAMWFDVTLDCGEAVKLRSQHFTKAHLTDVEALHRAGFDHYGCVMDPSGKPGHGATKRPTVLPTGGGPASAGLQPTRASLENISSVFCPLDPLATPSMFPSSVKGGSETCYICCSSPGVLLPCSDPGCDHLLHVTCALSEGCLTVPGVHGFACPIHSAEANMFEDRNIEIARTFNSTLFRPASWAEAAAGVTRLSRPLMRGKVRTMRAKLRETFSLSQDHMLAADVVMMKAHRSNAKVHGAAAKSVRAQLGPEHIRSIVPYPASQFVSMEEEGGEEQSADEDQSERYVTCRDMVDPLTAEQIIAGEHPGTITVGDIVSRGANHSTVIGEIIDPEHPAKKMSSEISYGLFAVIPILSGTPIGEYLGEVKFRSVYDSEVTMTNEEKKVYTMNITVTMDRGTMQRDGLDEANAEDGSLALVKVDARYESDYLLCDGLDHGSECRYINDFRDFIQNEATGGMTLNRRSRRRPNVVLQEYIRDGFPRIIVVASAPIQPGEELLVDYGMESYWRHIEQLSRFKHEMKRRDAEISDMHELMAELQGEVDKLKVQLAGDGTAELDQEVELAASARDVTVTELQELKDSLAEQMQLAASLEAPIQLDQPIAPDEPDYDQLLHEQVQLAAIAKDEMKRSKQVQESAAKEARARVKLEDAQRRLEAKETSRLEKEAKKEEALLLKMQKDETARVQKQAREDALRQKQEAAQLKKIADAKAKSAAGESSRARAGSAVGVKPGVVPAKASIKHTSKASSKGLATVLAPVDAPEGENYVVELVVGKQEIGGIVHYLVKWLGFDWEHNTWEITDSFDASDMRAVAAFEKDVAAGKTVEVGASTSNGHAASSLAANNKKREPEREKLVGKAKRPKK